MKKSLLLEVYYKNPRLIIDSISKYYHLKSYQINDNFHFLNLSLLLTNSGKRMWNEKDIESLKDDKIIKIFLNSGCIQLNNNLLLKYYKLIDYRPYSLDYIYDDTEIPSKDIYNDDSIIWDDNLIMKLSEKLDWFGLSNSKKLKISINILEKFIDRWDWECLSKNDNIDWNTEILLKFKDKINWILISENKSLLKISKKDLEKLNHLICWDIFFGNQPFSNKDFDGEGIFNDFFDLHLGQRVDTYYDFFSNFIDLKMISFSSDEFKPDIYDNYYYYDNSLYYSDLVIFHSEYKEKWVYKSAVEVKKTDYDSPIGFNSKFIKFYFIEKYNHNNFFETDSQIDYEKYSSHIIDMRSIISKNENIIGIGFWNMFQEYINWEKFCENRSFPMDIDFIEKFDHILNWEKLSANSLLSWKNEILEKYRNKLHWDLLSKNHVVKWDYYSIIKFSEFINFEEISSNRSIIWSDELIELFDDKWNWNALLRNRSFPWTKSLVENKIDRINIDWLEKYDRDTKIKKTLSFIFDLKDEYKNAMFDRFDLDEKNIFKKLSSETNIIWSNDFIDKNIDLLDWDLLSENIKAINSFETLSKFAHKLKVSENIWNIIESYIDDEFVDILFSNVNNFNSEKKID